MWGGNVYAAALSGITNSDPLKPEDHMKSDQTVVPTQTFTAEPGVAIDPPGLGDLMADAVAEMDQPPPLQPRGDLATLPAYRSVHAVQAAQIEEVRPDGVTVRYGVTSWDVPMWTEATVEHGGVSCLPGHWLVIERDGSQRTMSDADFQANYARC